MLALIETETQHNIETRTVGSDAKVPLETIKEEVDRHLAAPPRDQEEEMQQQAEVVESILNTRIDATLLVVGSTHLQYLSATITA